MTQTIFNLTKHIISKDLRCIESDIKAVQSNLKAKQWVLERKNKLPMQSQIEGIESKYRLDYYKYSKNSKHQSTIQANQHPKGHSAVATKNVNA